MSSAELDSLIVQNLGDLDGAAKRLHLLQNRVFKALGASAEKWAKRHGWRGSFDWWSDDFWLAPPEWKEAGSDINYDGFFSLELGAGDSGDWLPEEDFFYLTRLCQIGNGAYGFRFHQSLLSKGKWKSFVREHAQFTEATAFRLDEDINFFMPVRIDPDALAAALRDDALEDALGPFEESMSHLKGARSAFDGLLKRIKGIAAAET